MKRRLLGSMLNSKDAAGFVNHTFTEGLTEQSVSSYERLLIVVIKRHR